MVLVSTLLSSLGKEPFWDGVELVIFHIRHVDLMLESDLHHLVDQHLGLLIALSQSRLHRQASVAGDETSNLLSSINCSLVVFLWSRLT